MGADGPDHRDGNFDGRRARHLPENHGTLRRQDRADDRTGGAMNQIAATIPILIVVLSGIAAMLAEAIRRPGERMYIAGFGLIGLVGAAVASCFLWDTDAVSFGVVRADNFALFINIVLCIVGILTMVFSHDVVEREEMPA